MVNILDKAKCCGCTACANVCPKGAIAMVPDEEGFLYPKVDEDKCVECGLCDKVCPIESGNMQETAVQGYIVRNNDPAIVEGSTSGGVFTAIAKQVLSEGGVVYGAGYDADMRVICKRADTIEVLKEMRGSKFVQSHLGDTFQSIKQELAAGTKILFTGTPCQVEGLVSFLKGKPKNLICVDFVCRGVPSPMLWHNYVQMMEKKFDAKMVGARFKHKTYGYHATTMKVDFANGKTYYGSGRVDPMMKAFVTELASRPSCARCAFKTVSRKSDITMFDCYNFAKVTGLPDDNKGYSSLFVQSEIGAALFEKIRGSMMVYPADVEALIQANGVMVRNSARANPKREAFYRYVGQCPIDEAMQKISPITFRDRCVEATKGVLYKTGLIQKAKALKKRLETRNSIDQT